MRRRNARIGGLGAAALVLMLVASGCVLDGRWTETTPEATWTSTRMADVSCIAPDDCYGLAYTLSGPMALQHWDGVAWDHVATAVGLLPIQGWELECWASDGCMALTQTWAEFTDPVLAAVWDGATFQGVESYDLGWYGPQLECFSEDWCVSWNADFGLTDVWTGSGWVRDDEILATTSGISGARDCTAPLQCVIVSSTAGKAEHIDGATRTVVDFPTGLGIRSLTCLSTAWCVAVGKTGSATWDGTAWTVRPLDLGTAAISAIHVDCAAPNACLAVAQRTAAAGGILVKAMYAGTTWADAPAPPTTSVGVHDVECPAGGQVCYVTGTLQSGQSRVWEYDWSAPPA